MLDQFEGTRPVEPAKYNKAKRKRPGGLITDRAKSTWTININNERHRDNWMKPNAVWRQERRDL